MSEKSDTSENGTGISIDGEIDAGWTSYYDPNEHGTMNSNNDKKKDETRTVSVTDADGGENSGDISSSMFPDEIDNPQELTERQREVILCAVQNPDVGYRQIAAMTGYTKPDTVMKNKCPEWYEEHFKDGVTSQTDGKEERQKNRREVKKIIKSSGRVKKADLVTKSGLSRKTVTSITQNMENNGLIEMSFGGNRQQERVYEWVGENDAGCESEESKQKEKDAPDPIEVPEEEEESENELEANFSEGDKKALSTLFSTEKEELKAGIDAMKSVATHDETVAALEWVEQNL